MLLNCTTRYGWEGLTARPFSASSRVRSALSMVMQIWLACPPALHHMLFDLHGIESQYQEVDCATCPDLTSMSKSLRVFILARLPPTSRNKISQNPQVYISEVGLAIAGKIWHTDTHQAATNQPFYHPRCHQLQPLFPPRWNSKFSITSTPKP
jgi:hypothetical protein